MREVLEITTTITQVVPAECGTERMFKRNCFVAGNHNGYKYRKFFLACQGEK